jgi:zinc protease
LYEEGLNGNASVSDLETMFQLIYMRFFAPRIDPVLFETWKAQTRQDIENRYANPGTQFSDTFARLMSSDHPRRRPPTLETLEGIDAGEVFEFYQDRFSDASDFTFVFVGPIDLETIRPLVEQYLGALPGAGREETWVDVGLRQPEGVFEETVNRGLEPVAQTRIAFNGSFDYEDQAERTGIRAMALALETRLRNRVREELGGTYSIGVGPSTSWQPVESYIFTIAFSADPERIDELVETVYEGIVRLKAEGPTPEQVADVKETLRRSFETDFQRDGTILNQLVSDYQRGVVPGASIESFEASVEAVTAESIQEDARQYLNMDDRVRVTLIPENAGQ